MTFLDNPKKKARAVLRDVLKSAYSGFYREKYGTCLTRAEQVAGSTAEWESLPTLSRQEIQETPLFKRFFVPFSEVDFLRVTSGTSGGGVIVVPRMKSVFATKNALNKRYLRDKHYRRLATFSAAHALYYEEFKGDLGIDSVYLDPGNPNLSAAILSQYKPEVLFGFPYAVTSLLPNLTNDTLASIQVLTLFGEWCSAIQWNNFRRLLPHTCIITEYASVESQTIIGGPCEVIINNGERYVHPLSDHVFAEVLDLATGEPVVEEGGSGEVVITVLHPTAFPLVRYRTGDRATIVRSSCSCGLSSPVLSIDGRIVIDRLRLPGGELNLAELDRVFSNLQTVVASSDFSLEYSEELYAGTPRPKVVVLLSWDKTKITEENLALHISQTLRVAPGTTYSDGVLVGKYAPLVVEHVPASNFFEKRVRIIRT